MFSACECEEIKGCSVHCSGPFEKFMQVTMILPLTGQQYSEKVAENCVAIWKSLGIYTDAEAQAIDKFVTVFKDETFPPGSSILFTVSPSGSLLVSDYGVNTYLTKYMSCINFTSCHGYSYKLATLIYFSYTLCCF